MQWVYADSTYPPSDYVQWVYTDGTYPPSDYAVSIHRHNIPTF